MSNYPFHDSFGSDLDHFSDEFYVDPYEYEDEYDDYDPMDPDSYEDDFGIPEDAAMEAGLFGWDA